MRKKSMPEYQPSNLPDNYHEADDKPILYSGNSESAELKSANRDAAETA
jgi:hypothetical protein